MRLSKMLLLLSVLWPLAVCSGQSWIDSSLTQIEVLHAGTQQHKTVQTLVNLDSTLKALVKVVATKFPNGGMPPDFRWQERYEKLGLFIGHYSDQIGYTEQFLVEAHALNPNSSYRPHTLYSTILGIQTFHGLGVMPNLDSAFAYVREFPRGPYTKDVYVLMGDFYKDLFMLLRDYKEKQDGEERYGEYLYDCYEPYVDGLPIQVQRDRAQRLSIQYYEEALKLDPDNEWLRHVHLKVREGTVDWWSYCAD